LPTLVRCIREERATFDTWIFVERSECWEKAGHVPELQMFFHGGGPSGTADSSDNSTAGMSSGIVDLASLRHVKILACLSDDQLRGLLAATEIENVPAGTRLARHGEPANSMYIVLEGELRVRGSMEGREASLGTLNAGEFFGEVSLFDHGLRCADIIAGTDSTVLRITSAEMEKLAYEAPQFAAPFLLALAKSLAVHIRADTKHYRDSISFIHPHR
jgi:CRP-like cAMP-binding protein